MCGRFGLYARLDAVEDYYDARFSFDYEPRYNLAPEGEGVAAVRNEAPGAIDRVQWGFVPRWVDDPEAWPRPINARAETVAEKPAFAWAFEHRRCLVPASNFYEWTGRRGARIPYAIGVADTDVFSMAGLWDAWSAGGEPVTSLAIVTTEANGVVGKLHDRMPVILDREEEARWLGEADPAELRALLDPLPDGRTTRWEVSTAVNDPTREGPALVEPVGSSQSGLGEFG